MARVTWNELTGNRGCYDNTKRSALVTVSGVRGIADEKKSRQREPQVAIAPAGTPLMLVLENFSTTHHIEERRVELM